MKLLHSSLLAAGLAVLVGPALVNAQQIQDTRAPVQPEDAAEGTQLDAAQLNDAQQRQDTEQDPDTDQAESQDDQRYEARRAATRFAGQGVPLQQAIVQKLRKANEAEIELAKMAQQRVDDPELKQLTQTIIDDHQALNQKLQQFASQKQSGVAGTDRPNRNRANRNRANRDRPNRDRLSGDRDRLSEDDDDDSQRRPLLSRGDDAENRADRQQRRGGQSAGSQSTNVPSQLVRIMEQACQNNLEMTKEMLDRYDGKDFQMAFLGQQAIAHTMLIAELKAIASEGPEELQPVVQEAVNTTQKHLEKSRQLAKKLDEDAGRSAR